MGENGDGLTQEMEKTSELIETNSPQDTVRLTWAAATQECICGCGKQRIGARLGDLETITDGKPIGHNRPRSRLKATIISKARPGDSATNISGECASMKREKAAWSRSKDSRRGSLSTVSGASAAPQTGNTVFPSPTGPENCSHSRTGAVDEGRKENDRMDQRAKEERQQTRERERERVVSTWSLGLTLFPSPRPENFRLKMKSVRTLSEDHPSLGSPRRSGEGGVAHPRRCRVLTLLDASRSTAPDSHPLRNSCKTATHGLLIEGLK